MILSKIIDFKVKGARLTQIGNLFSVLLGILLCMRHVSLIDIPLYYISLLTLVIIATTLKNRPHINISIALFILSLAVSLAFNPHNFIMIRSMRFCALSIGLAYFAPLLLSPTLNNYRRLTFISIYVTLSILIIISFIIWIYLQGTIGQNMIWQSSYFYYGFRGVFKMGMILSPASAFVAIISFYNLILSQSQKYSGLLGILGSISVIMCLVGGSRCAFVALILALSVLSFGKRSEIKQLLKQKYNIALLLCTTLLFIVILPTTTELILQKLNLSLSQGSIFHTRQLHWAARLSEFLDSPLLGIGYANEFSNELNNGDLTTLEPGSSWLSLLSYGGLICTLLFGYIMAQLFKKIRLNSHRANMALIKALMTFCIIYGITEGWLLFAGSLFFTIFWLIVSVGWEQDITTYTTKL